MSDPKAPSSEMVNRAVAAVDELRQAGHPIDLIAIEMATEVARLADEIERLRDAITEAIRDLADEHRPDGHPDREPWGCVYCYPGDSNWPCFSRMVAADLTEALKGGSNE